MPFSFDFGGFDPSAFGGFSGGDASQPQRPKRERKPRKAIGNAFTRTLINLGVTLLFGLGYFYFELPALNFHAEEFYVFVFLLCAVYCVCAVLTSGFQGEGVKGYFGFVKKQCTIPFLVLVALIAAIIIGGLTSWVVIRAGSYSKLLSIKDGDFASEVEEISYNQIPMLDEDSAARLGSRKLGELADMVSQFEILPSYTQINYQGRPVRVTSLADYTENVNPQFDYESKALYASEFEGMRSMFQLCGGALSFIVGLVGVLNFFNAILTGILTRKREFAVLQSIGMTGRQLKIMLVWEGLFYALGSILIALVLALVLGPLSAPTLENLFWFFTYHLTVTPVLILLPIFLLLGGLVPLAVYRSVARVSVVERLREAEG